MIPAAIGVVLAIAIYGMLAITGLTRNRGALAILLVAIASYYLVFSFDHGHPSELFWHSIAVAAFVGLAALGLHRGTAIIAIGLIAHGLFDIAIVPLFSASAPDWWAAFCAGVDITLGGLILLTPKKAFT